MGFRDTVRNWLGVNNQPTLVTSVPLNQRTNRLDEYWVWYAEPDAKKLTNFYMGMKGVIGKQDYFYCRSAYEKNKKTHSGLPKAIVDTICNTTGIPTYKVEGDDVSDAYLKDICEKNDFANIIKQVMRPRTLVIGGGCLWVSNLKAVNERFDVPIFEFVDERECDIEMVGNIFISATKKTGYTHAGENYVLHEKRSYNLIENVLYNSKGNVVGLDKIPDTEHLESKINLNINDIAAIPVRYKNGVWSYGSSIFAGKVDQFDDLDQTHSQISELVRKFTVVTFASAELFDKDKQGNVLAPDEFDVRVMTLKASKRQDDKPLFERMYPSVVFSEIISAEVQQTISILQGILSPSSLGIEVQRNNNAEAMREKEKVTLVTRDDIIDNEKFVIKKALSIALKIYDYMNGRVPKDYSIAVDYPDFSSPTFEQLVATFLPMYAANAISPKQFVESLYGDTMTEEDKADEIAFLQESKEPVTNMDFFGGIEQSTTQTPSDQHSEMTKDQQQDNVQQ